MNSKQEWEEIKVIFCHVQPTKLISIIERIEGEDVQLAKKVGLFTGMENNKIFPVTKYSLFPLLFKELLNEQDNVITTICRLSHYASIWSIIQDELFDSNVQKNDFRILLLSALVNECMCLVNSLDRNGKLQLKKRFTDATYTVIKNFRLEVELGECSTANDKDIFKYCKNKYAMAAFLGYCTLSICKAEASTKQDVIHSIENYSVLRQCADELEDVDEDRANGSVNITKFKTEKQIREIAQIAYENAMKLATIHEEVGLLALLNFTKSNQILLD